MRKILLLEDNEVTLQHLTTLVREIDERNEVYSCTNRTEAYQYALEKEIDLFIVDIILDTIKQGDSSGLKFVECIRELERYAFTPVIFVTSLEDARLFSYEQLHCYSFLKKPFDPEKLKNEVTQCLHFPKVRRKNKILRFHKDGVLFTVNRDEIVYAEVVNRMMKIHTNKKDVLKLPYMTLKEFIKDVDDPDFIQCRRNVVVNKAYVRDVDFGNRYIHFKHQLGSVEIGLQFKKTVEEFF